MASLKESNEEVWVKAWLEELKDNGYVIDYEYQPTFTLYNEVVVETGDFDTKQKNVCIPQIIL